MKRTKLFPCTPKDFFLLNQQQIVLVSLLFLMNFLSASCQGQQNNHTEKQLKAELDDFWAQYRHEKEKTEEMADFFHTMQDSSALVHGHKVFQEMQQFYHAHQKQYRRLRLASVTRYPPAPKEFPGYDTINLEFLHNYNEQKSRALQKAMNLEQKIVNIKVFSLPEAISPVNGILYSFLDDYLEEEKGYDWQNIFDRQKFGVRFFADETDKTNWKITAVNRAYVLSYQWDITTNRVRLENVLVYKDEEPQKGWLEESLPQPKNRKPQSILRRQLNEFEWALFDQLYPDLSFDTFMEHMEDFIESHRKKYIAARRSNLSQLPNTNDARWEAYSQVDKEITGEFERHFYIHSYEKAELPISISYEDLGTVNTFSAFLTVLAQKEIDYQDINPGMISWPWDSEKYARKLDKYRWQIRFYYGNFAVGYHWNIATDELSEIEIRRK